MALITSQDVYEHIMAVRAARIQTEREAYARRLAAEKVRMVAALRAKLSTLRGEELAAALRILQEEA